MANKGKLYGVGVGPGDPELLTVKACRILKEVDKIFTPVKEKAGTSRALTIAARQLDCRDKTEKLVFPMTSDSKTLKSAWRENARIIKDELSLGREVAFITIGDPLFYSTYIYLIDNLREIFPEAEIETVPGIMSPQLAAARAELPLARGRERFLVLPEIPEKKEMKRLLSGKTSLVILKVSRNPKKLFSFLSRNSREYEFFFISKCGYPEEEIITDLDRLKQIDIDYLSLVICRTVD